MTLCSNSPAVRQNPKISKTLYGLGVALATMVVAVMLTIAGAPVHTSIAQAQGNSAYFGYTNAQKRKLRRLRQQRLARKRRAQRRYRKRRAKRKSQPAIPKRKAEGPLTAVVSLNSQTMTVYDSVGPLARTRVSTGRSGYRTPTGVFSIIQKRKRHYSNLYANAPMPFMQRITWSGIAIHAGVVPGYPASHGCIRLPYNFASRFWKMTEMGTRVVITRNGAKPSEFTHALLFRPLPPGTPDPAVSPDEDGNDGSDPTLGQNKSPENAASVEEFIGVTKANAAPSETTRTRAFVAKERLVDIQRLEQALADAKSTVGGAASELKEINELLSETKKEIYAAKKEVRALKSAEKKAKANYTQTVKKLKKFFRKFSTAKTEEQIALGIKQEEALEATLLDFEKDASDAVAERKAVEESITVGNDKIASLIEQRKIRKANYITKKKSVVKAQKDLKSAQLSLKHYNKPVHILISRKSQKLYMRQGHRDILEADIEFEEPSAPVGTHLFTAKEYISDGSDVSWTVLTAAKKYKQARKKSRKRKNRDTQVLANGPAQTPENALERVIISQELREKIAEYIKPESSLIISDERKSLETGLGTDLIVETRS